MKINWLGHSAFLLTESTGASVLTDPFSGIGYNLPSVEADVITVSHNHDDHNALKKVKKYKKVLSKAGNFDEFGIHFTGVKTHHDDQNGSLRGENVIYKFNLDGINVCHMGDIGEECSPELIEQLLPVNVLMIPVGGTYTVDAEGAKKYVDALMPDVVLPMHYKYKHCSLDIDRVDEFLDLFEDDDVVIEEAAELELDRYDLNEQQKTTRIVLLDRLGDE